MSSDLSSSEPLTLRSLLGDADMDMLRDCFIALDHDGDGLISPHVIGEAVLRVIGAERYLAYEPYLLGIFDAADKDRDGFLNLIEFIECYAEGPGILPHNVVAECVSGVKIRMTDAEVNLLQKVFFAMDTDSDGLVGHADLEAALADAFFLPNAQQPNEEGHQQEVQPDRNVVRNKKYAHLTPNDIGSMASEIVNTCDRDGDGKLNISDFILSFQLDQRVVPIELIEVKPSLLPLQQQDQQGEAHQQQASSSSSTSVLLGLSAEDLVAIRNAVLPYLIAEDERRRTLEHDEADQQGEEEREEEEDAVDISSALVAAAGNDQNHLNSVMISTGKVSPAAARPPSPLQAPYGRLFTLVRTLLIGALADHYSHSDIDIITDAILAEGVIIEIPFSPEGRALVPDEEGSGVDDNIHNMNVNRNKGEINIVDILVKIVSAAEETNYFRGLVVRGGRREGGEDVDDNGDHQHQDVNNTIMNTTYNKDLGNDESFLLLSPTRAQGGPPTAVAPSSAQTTAGGDINNNEKGKSNEGIVSDQPSNAKPNNNKFLPPLAPAPSALGSLQSGGTSNINNNGPLSSSSRPSSASAVNKGNNNYNNPYPSESVSARKPSALSLASKGHPTTAANTTSANAAPAAAFGVYAPYVHPPITTLEEEHPAAAENTTIISNKEDQAVSASTTPSPPPAVVNHNRRISVSTRAADGGGGGQKLLDPEALKKVFVHLATNIIMTSTKKKKDTKSSTASDDNTVVVVEGPSAFVQRLAFKDIKQYTTGYLADVFPHWTLEQINVAAETLWSKAVSARGTADGSEDDFVKEELSSSLVNGGKDSQEKEEDDDGESADMGYLTLDSFIHSYKVGGELTAVMPDCSTFVVVNIGVLPLSVANKIARSIPVAMNKVQQRVVRAAFISLLRAINRKRLADRGHTIEGVLLAEEVEKRHAEINDRENRNKNEQTQASENKQQSNDPVAKFCTVDVPIDDLRYALQKALEPYIVFDMDPSTAEFYPSTIEDKKEQMQEGEGVGGKARKKSIILEDFAKAQAAHTHAPQDPKEHRRVVTVVDKIIRLAKENETVFDSNPVNITESRLCVNLFSVAAELGIKMPETMTAVLTSEANSNDEDEEYDMFGNKNGKKEENSGDLVSKGGDAAPSSSSSSVHEASLTVFELALVGAMLQRLATQDSVSVSNLEEMIVDIFIPPHTKKVMTENNDNAVALLHSKNKIRAVKRSLLKIAGEKRAPPVTAAGVVIPKHLRSDYDPSSQKKSEYDDDDDLFDDDTRPVKVRIGSLAKDFEKNPSVLKLGLSLSEGGVASAIEGLVSCGLDANDLRTITEHLVTIDRDKDGALPLVSAYRDLRKIVERSRPMWDVHQIDRPATLILNAAMLSQEGRITFTQLIRACAAEFYLTPEKHSQPHSGALSRRLDTTDLAKVRRAVESVPSSTPLDKQEEAIRAAVVEASIVGDAASLSAMVDTIFACLRQQKISTEKLAENLLDNPSLLSFPIMQARDCHDVCLRKLKLSVPPEVIQVIARTLLLADTKGDGLLRRDNVEEKLMRALILSFGSEERSGARESESESSTTAAATTAAASPTKLLLLPPHHNGGVTALGTTKHSSSSSPDQNSKSIIRLGSEKITEIVRLIILSQFEQIGAGVASSPTKHIHNQSTTGANRNLEMNGFIDVLVNTVDGAILPRAYLPDVEIPFKAPLGFDEVDILQGAIESIAADKRVAMTAVDLSNLLESAMQDRRRPFVKVIGDIMLKLADGPENSRFDMTNLAQNFTLTQKLLTFHTSQLPPLMCDRVAGRVIRRDKVRRLARVFAAIDINRDNKLSRDEIFPHLLADAHRTVTDSVLAKNMANARWAEVESLALSHNNSNNSSSAVVGASAKHTQVSFDRRTTKEINESKTLISFETFLSTFCLGKFPLLSELEMEMILKRASSAADLAAIGVGGGANRTPTSPSAAAQQNLIVSGGAAHRLLRASPSGGSGSGANAAGDYDASGIALPYDAETSLTNNNNNRSRYLSARNLSEVPVFDDELQQDFNFYDAEGKGYLDRSTFQRQYRLEMEHYGVRPSEAQVAEVFNTVCDDKNRVTFEEFCLLMLKRSKM